MIIYYFPIFATLIALLTLNFKNTKVFFAYCIFIFMIIFVGLRYFSDVDYEPYYELFDTTPSLFNLNLHELSVLYGEPGYLLVSALFKSFGLGFVSVALFSVILAVYLKLKILSAITGQYILAFTLYLAIHFVTIEFIQLRWAVASGFIVAALYNILKGNKKFALIMLILATSFHYFSLIFLPMFIFRKLSARTVNAIFITSFLAAMFYKFVGFSFIYIADTNIYIIKRFLRYLNDPESSVGIFSFSRLILYYVTFVLIRKFVRRDADEQYYDLDKMSLLLLSISLFLSFIPLMYFRAVNIADLFCIATILYQFEKNKNGYTLLYLVVLVVLFCTWNILDVQNNYNAGYIFEYKNWLETIF